MKKQPKVIALFLLFNLWASPSFSGNFILDALDGFNNMVEAIEKLWKSFDSINSEINREQTKMMASELFRNIDDLVLAKEKLLFKLENDVNNDLKYQNEIDSLLIKTRAVQSTLKKYDNLIAAVGMDAEVLRSQLNHDFFQKTQTLELAKGLFAQNNISAPDVKKQLIIYYKSGINILKRSQDLLVKFSKE